MKNSFIATDPQSHKGATDTWLTPLWIFDYLGEFDFDPCPFVGHQTAKILHDGDGLKTDWLGKVWLNPPYSELETWLDKLSEHGYGTALIFNRCDTKTLQRHLRLADSVFFLSGRIKFLKPDFTVGHNAGTGSMLLSYGWTPDYKGLKGWKAK